MKTLIVVDAQYDFIEGGTLAVPGGFKVTEDIANLIHTQRYEMILFTQDWHIDPGSHWSDNPDYIDSWPVHCKAETTGASIAEAIMWSVRSRASRSESLILNTFKKGQYAASYSGMDGIDSNGTGLLTWLNAFNVSEVEVVGIAYDYCVAATALDLAGEGIKVTVLKDFTASVHPNKDDETTTKLESAGIEIV